MRFLLQGKTAKTALLVIVLLATQSCATSGALGLARDQFKNGSTQDALATLDNAEVSSRDQLLLYLDKGLFSQAAARYADSISAFEEALKLIDKLDYFSARDQGASLVTSDWAIRYGGESSERLWVHTFQMINYLMLGQPQGAAVEARRAVALFKEHGDVLNQDIFTRYLMALSFEAAGQYDSAKVEYRKLKAELNLQMPVSLKKNEGELILLIATGFIPPKLPGDLLIDLDVRVSFPYYAEFHQDYLPEIEVTRKGKRIAIERVDTKLLSVARSALKQRGKSIAARQAIRLAAKYNLADNISDKDPMAGAIAKLLLLAVERADTRSWESLPANLSMVRMTIPREESSVSVVVEDGSKFSNAIHRIDVPVDFSTTQRNFYLIRLGIDSI